MIAKDTSTPDTIAQETVKTYYIQEKNIVPDINIGTDYKDFKFKVEVNPAGWENDYTVFIKNFKAMDGGMIEHTQASHHVNSVSSKGSISHCTLEVDSEIRKCLNCIGTRFFDKAAGQCVLCSSRMPNCAFCHKENICDSCQDYKDVFGSSNCLTDISLCVEPKYSRYNQERCDSCEHAAPNTCRCGPHWDLVNSSLGGTRKMCSCKIANCNSKNSFIFVINLSLGLDCSASTTKCAKCLEGFYYKVGATDECIEDKQIRTLTQPRYGVDLAAAVKTIKPCSDPVCLSCALDFTQCSCYPGQFSYTTNLNPIENKVCSSTNNVVGYGLSSSPNPHRGLTLLEACLVSNCQDCKLNNQECRQCPTGYYFQPPSNGVYEGCYPVGSIPDGWVRREGSFELLDCTEGLYFYEQSSKLCRYKALVEITDISTNESKENNKAVFRIRVDKGELRIIDGVPPSSGSLELSDTDLLAFLSYHFEIQTEPSTQLTQEVKGDQLGLSYPEYSVSFKIKFKIKQQAIQHSYNSKEVQSPPNSVLKYKNNEGLTQLEFEVFPKQRPQESTQPQPAQQYLSESQVTYTKVSSKATQTISVASRILTLVLLVANIDLSSTIFKIIQIITIFDKLRFINVDIKNSFGDFIRFIGDLFKVGLIQSDDYHIASVPKYNKFEKLDYSVISYRNKPDKILFLFAGIILNIVAMFITKSIKGLKNTDYFKIEKKGLLIKKLKKIASGLHLMTVADVFFVTGHQILHQDMSNLFVNPEYLASYILSVISFSYCCWLVLRIALSFTKPSSEEVQKLSESKAVSTEVQKEKVKRNKVHPEGESPTNNPLRFRRLSRREGVSNLISQRSNSRKTKTKSK